MLSITDGGSLTRALALPLNLGLKRLLAIRRDQIGADYARFLIVEPGITLEAVIDALGFPLLLDDTPTWEWIEDHGFAFELVFILDDSGFAHVLLVQQLDGMDPELIALCKAHASEHA